MDLQHGLQQQLGLQQLALPLRRWRRHSEERWGSLRRLQQAALS
jgi:hypothetical protein